MRYASLNGGKRIRAALVYATAAALGVDADYLDFPACAVELIHAYSLVHDDLPCMDDDDLRRGKPTCHKAYDEATALLVGDALQTLAFEVLSNRSLPNALTMVKALAQASGAGGMAGGQALDLAAVGKTLNLAQLEDMHRRKTGALLRASIKLGVLACGQVDEKIQLKLDAYAENIGLAFQVIDDILDVEGNTAILGKTAHADSARAKPTYPAVLGLTAAKSKARQLQGAALASLDILGDNGKILGDIANYVISRTY